MTVPTIFFIIFCELLILVPAHLVSFSFLCLTFF